MLLLLPVHLLTLAVTLTVHIRDRSCTRHKLRSNISASFDTSSLLRMR